MSMTEYENQQVCINELESEIARLESEVELQQGKIMEAVKMLKQNRLEDAKTILQI